MATYTKIQDFTEQLIRGIHDWDLHTFKLLLTNTAPLVSNTIKTDLVEITSKNGYPSGGLSTTITLSESAGTTTVQGTSTVFAATAATDTTGIGPFRYVVLYNDSATNKNLIAFWDYGTAITLNEGETFSVKFNNASPGTIFTLV